MTFFITHGNRWSWSLWLLIFLEPFRHTFLQVDGQAPSNTTTSISILAPQLPNTLVDYEETSNTFVSYPADAEDLLQDELSHYPDAVVFEVTSVVTHWQGPIWDLIKGIVLRLQAGNPLLVFKTHYYVGNGMSTTMGCRVESVDVYSGQIAEQASDSDICLQHCTNHGRYCAPEVPSDMNPAISPNKLVEETLRRLCIDSLYNQGNDFRPWEYRDAFKLLECHEMTNLTTCAQQAFQQGLAYRIDAATVEECMLLAGGLEADVMNAKLQEQIDQQQGSYDLTDIPMLYVQGKRYERPWTVASIFETVCEALRWSQKSPPTKLPLACQVCGKCQNVRRCLWYLECDGRAFYSSAFRDPTFLPTNNNNSTMVPTEMTLSHAPEAEMPVTATPPPEMTWFNNMDNIKNSSNPSETIVTINTEEEDVNTTGSFVTGILIGLVLGSLPACWFNQREKRTRRQIAAAMAYREQQFRDATINDTSYKDDLDHGYRGNKDPPMQNEFPNLDEISLNEFGEPQNRQQVEGNNGNHNHNHHHQQQHQDQQPSKKPPRMSFLMHQVV